MLYVLVVTLVSKSIRSNRNDDDSRLHINVHTTYVRQHCLFKITNNFNLFIFADQNQYKTNK